MKARDLAPAAGVFVIALAWLLLLRPYGFQLEDEGTILSWFDRVARGQQPYLDFHTGYAPGFFALGSAAFSLFGTSATALRGALAVVNATSAALLCEVARRVVGRRYAPVAPLLWLAFMPVYVGEFAAFDVPYPTWPVTLAWAVLALALLAWVEAPRHAILALAGGIAAFMMAMRPNSGAFALAAATWVVVATAPRRGVVGRAVAWAASLFMAAGVAYTFQFRFGGADGVVHLGPVVAIALLYAGPVSRALRRDGAPRVRVSVAVLAASFALPTLVWTLPLVGRLGVDGFLREVLLVGADVQTIYHGAPPASEPYAVLVVAAVVALALAARVVEAGRVRPWTPVAVAAAGVVVARLAFVRDAIAPEGVLASVVGQFENASFWLAATANLAGVAWAGAVGMGEWAARMDRPAARGVGVSSPRVRARLVLVPLAVAMYLQLYPRNDFMHQVSAVPLTAVLACSLLTGVAARWARGTWPGGWRGRDVVDGVVLATVAVVIVTAFVTKGSGPVEAWVDPAPDAAMPRRLDVHVEAAAPDELAAIAATVSFLRARTTPNEALWAFPATSGILFAAGLTNATPYDYWFPGRPDHVEEERVVAALRSSPPRYGVTLGRGFAFFTGAPAYFAALRGWVAANYRLVARHGRYDVLARNDVAADDRGGRGALIQASGRARRAGDAEPFVAFPRTPEETPSPAGEGGDAARGAVLVPNLEQRRQAVRRWMDAVTPADAKRAQLPASTRDQLLLMRALKEGGDLRGAAWVVLGASSQNPRVRKEAAEAMVAIAREFDDERFRLAHDFDAAEWRPFVAGWVERANAVAQGDELAPFRDAIALVTAPPH